MVTGTHPIELLSIYRTQTSLEAEVEFGLYVHTPGCIQDRREIVRVPIGMAREWFYSHMLEAERAGKEIALQSRVYFTDGSIHHIPMCDLTGKRGRPEIKRVCDAMKLFDVDTGYIFNSGRSYHVYGDKLIPESAFVPLSAALLLTNETRRRPTVDERWVAHRLLAGYYALRLTRVHKHYRRGPQFMYEINGEVHEVSSEVTEELDNRTEFHI